MAPEPEQHPPEQHLERHLPEQRPPRLTLDGLADRLGVSVRAVVIGAAAVAAAGAGGWWALRPPPAPDPEVVLPRVGEVPVPSIPSPVSPALAVIRVHVTGAVADPDIVYELDDGALVIDAVAAAGGFADDADRSRLNLAQALDDGARLWVPARGEADEPAVVNPDPPEPVDGSGAPPGGRVCVDINEADAAALEALPGIGPVKAADIVDHRERLGPFAALDGLAAVTGIGPKTVDRLRPSAHAGAGCQPAP